ncbi:MAG: hypothetical protein V4724_15470 [Pseudomonadota bacterium]
MNFSVRVALGNKIPCFLLIIAANRRAEGGIGGLNISYLFNQAIFEFREKTRFARNSLWVISEKKRKKGPLSGLMPLS